MVLSNTVATGPRSRSQDRDRPEGPWGNTNRTVANIDPRRRREPPRPSVRGRNAKDKEEQDKNAIEDRFKALKMQRALISIPYRERMLVKARISDIVSFDQFQLLPVVKEAIFNEVLKGLEDIKPTPVQKLAIPALLGQPLSRAHAIARAKKPTKQRDEYLLAAETGSGKTLAYLAPTIHHLKVEETKDEAVAAYNERLEAEKQRREGEPVSEWIDDFEPHPYTARPRAIVLVPTAELVDQVLAVAKSMSHVVKLKVRGLSAKYSVQKIQRNVYSHGGIDMLVSTPHLLASLAKRDPNILSRVRHLIIDEADSLFDRSFSPETSEIVDRSIPSLRQLILCSATIPRRLDNYLAENFPYINRIATPNVHAIPRRVQLGVIDCSKDPYRGNKLLACADAIWTIGKEAAVHETSDGLIDVKRLMVFVNERETTQEVADYLKSKGIEAIALHRDTPEQRQSEWLEYFRSNEPLQITKEEAEKRKAAVQARLGPGKRYLPNVRVIVATDLASRGIDTLAVRTVILYDVPHTTIDFIHRLGRAGRMNRRGRGIVLVGDGDRRDVVADVKEAMFMGQALI